MEGEAVLRKVSITQRQFGLHCVDSQVQKGNSTLAKLRSAKACEKAAKGNGSVLVFVFPPQIFSQLKIELAHNPRLSNLC